MRRLFLAIAVLTQATAATAADPVRRLDVPDPRRHWLDGGFVEMVPPVRVSIGAGAETAVFLRLPAGGRIVARLVPGTSAPTLVLPPGTEVDRVSYATFDEGRQRSVADVRGTRWDVAGREYFHVYRPRSADIDAPLLGYEWPRDDAAAVRRATELLVELVRTHPAPLWGWRYGPADVSAFRALNDCAACHVADKPVALRADEALPPWATDASGLYVPLAVLLDQAPLSTSPAFRDPNVDDPFVVARCGDRDAIRRGWRSWAWYACADGSVPMGERNVRDGLMAGDGYTRQVCIARRYLYRHMEASGRIAFAGAFAACGIRPDG